MSVWGLGTRPFSILSGIRFLHLVFIPSDTLHRSTRERERERKRKSNFDAGKNHATTIIVGTPVAAIEPVLGDAGDDAIASV